MQREKSLSLKDVFGVVVKRKWLFILPIVGVVGLAYGATFVLAPKYESSTIIWIDQPSNVSRELTSILGREGSPRQGDEARGRRIKALQNELTSRTYLQQLISTLGLDKDPEVTRTAARMREEHPSYSLEQLKFDVLSDRLRKQIKVDFVGQDQIQLTVESSDPKQARDMVSTLTNILEQEKTKYELETILDNQSFADLQLQRTEHYYQQMIDSLTDAQTRMTTLQLPDNISSEANRRDILSDIDKAQQDINDYSTQLDQLTSQLKSLGLSDAHIKHPDSIVDLRTEIDGDVVRMASMMGKYAWNDQNVINVNIRLNDNLRELEGMIQRAVDDQFASYPSDQRDLLKRYFIVEEHLDIIKSQKTRLQNALDQIDKRINQLPKLQAQLSELERKVADARKYRDAFRSEEATVEILSQQAKERTKYRVIEPPRVPVAPTWPNLKKIMVLGLVLGFVLGGAAVFTAEMFDNSIKRVEDVEDLFELPVLATIPKIEQLRSIRR